jgi:hypothetical protein
MFQRRNWQGSLDSWGSTALHRMGPRLVGFRAPTDLILVGVAFLSVNRA